LKSYRAILEDFDRPFIYEKFKEYGYVMEWSSYDLDEDYSNNVNKKDKEK
jgi:hypothetical protein